MGLLRLCSALVVVSALSACGGGGGGSGGGGNGQAPSAPAPAPPVTPPAPAEVRLTVSTPPISKTAAFGDDVRTEVAGEWTATNLGTGQVFLQIADDTATFATPAISAASNRAFTYALPFNDTVVPGTRSGTLTVRACEDVQCVKPYANATQTLAYTVKIVPMPEWETTQGNAAHNGYVPIRLDVAKFAKAWEWKRPVISTSGTSGPIHPVVTSGRMVYVGEDVGYGPSKLYALNERDGSVQWFQPFNLQLGALNAPAASSGGVYIPTTGHSDTYLWAFDAISGAPRVRTSFSTQWSRILAPTIKNGLAYVNAGYYGGVVYAFDGSGLMAWQASGGTSDMNAPAFDDANRMYVHNGDTLNVHDARNGTSLGSIGTTPYGMQTSHHGTAVVGGPDSVTALWGNSYSESASRPLRNYSIDALAVRWTTVKQYQPYPAIANGVIYATANNPRSFDAIDEKTGQILWSWVPGTSDGAFYRNVVVTDNLVFISTDRNLYAIDLQTHIPVWQSPTPGSVAISASRMLYVTTIAQAYPGGTVTSDGRLVAFRTR